MLVGGKEVTKDNFLVSANSLENGFSSPEISQDIINSLKINSAIIEGNGLRTFSKNTQTKENHKR